MLTFTPPDDVLVAMGHPKRRRDPKEVGMRSWSNRDVDVLFQPRTLVHFTGDARKPWMHAIRAGVQVDGAGADGGPATCDWWGATDYLLRRGPRRISVVLAFGEPADIFITTGAAVIVASAGYIARREMQLKGR